MQKYFFRKETSGLSKGQKSIPFTQHESAKTALKSALLYQAFFFFSFQGLNLKNWGKKNPRSSYFTEQILIDQRGKKSELFSLLQQFL